MSKVAFITGIAGQDGAYLTALLLDKGYHVHGLVRWDSGMDPMDSMARFDALGLVADNVTLHMGDITDANSVNAVIKKVQPTEIYNLAGMSQGGVSFDTASSTIDINTQGAMNIFAAVQVLGMEERVRVYQASSSEMFGSSPAPQNEDTPMHPCSPYGVAKLAAYWMARTYRDAYGLHISNGILFNHESPLRGEDFVTTKIIRAVASIEAKQQSDFLLGNLDSKRDWGHARDYVEGMWRILQQDKADDYVLATGKSYSVRDFVGYAFAAIGVTLEWRGEGADEMGYDADSGQMYVRIDPALYRPNEVNYLLGDPSKARDILGWEACTSLSDMVAEMLVSERERLWDEKGWSSVTEGDPEDISDVGSDGDCVIG